MFFRNSVVACISAAAGSFLWQFPALLQGRTPLPTAPHHLLDCIRFLDAHKDEWHVESTNFPSVGKLGDVTNDPGLQVLRLGKAYESGLEGDRPVPVLRLIGYLPGVSPEEVHRYLTDIKLRRQWDSNYTMFCRWDGEERKLIDPLAGVQRPMEHVTRKNPVCEGDRCTLVPDVTHHVVDSGWFAHRVGNALLEKFGIAERLFVYKRRSFCYRKLGSDTNALRMYDVLYSGSGEMVNYARSQCERFAEWMRSCDGGHKTSRVCMNYQHILIVPISDVMLQVWERPDRLSFGGSMINEKDTRTVYEMFLETADHIKNTRKLDGTLVIMTSANDANIPSHIPLWIQRKLTSVFSNYVYQRLLQAILSERKDVQPGASS